MTMGCDVATVSNLFHFIASESVRFWRAGIILVFSYHSLKDVCLRAKTVRGLRYDGLSCWMSRCFPVTCAPSSVSVDVGVCLWYSRRIWRSKSAVDYRVFTVNGGVPDAWMMFLHSAMLGPVDSISRSSTPYDMSR